MPPEPPTTLYLHFQYTPLPPRKILATRLHSYVLQSNVAYDILYFVQSQLRLSKFWTTT